jgi:hypothetical protein
LSWTANGVPLDVGNFSKVLPLAAAVPGVTSYYQAFKVTVTVKDGGDTASASVMVYAVRTIIL